MKVLWIEDERFTRDLVCRKMSRIEWTHADTLAIAMSLLKDRSFDVILLDIVIADAREMNTLHHLDEIKSAAKGAPVIVFSGSDDPSNVELAMSKGADDYLTKNILCGALCQLAFTLMTAVLRAKRHE